MGMVTWFVLAGIGGGGLFIGTKIAINKMKKKEENEKYVSTTQDHLPFKEIKRSVVKLKKGGYRMVVEIPSVNLDLMSEAERYTVWVQYRQVLNTMTFPFQYLEQSRVVDISEYMSTLESFKHMADEGIEKNQLDSYASFLRELIEVRSVLTRKFYIVIPYDPERESKENRKKQYDALDSKKKKNKKAQQIAEQNDAQKEKKEYEHAIKELESRAKQVVRLYRRFDIKPHILNDRELHELYYTSYNKDRSVFQPLKDRDPEDFTSLYVKVKKEGE